MKRIEVEVRAKIAATRQEAIEAQAQRRLAGPETLPPAIPVLSE